MATNNGFSLFVNLPAEIRALIWLAALPNSPRIYMLEDDLLDGEIEEDLMKTLLDLGTAQREDWLARFKASHQASIADIKNLRRVPIILQVCRESRQIAHLLGYHRRFSSLDPHCQVWFNFNDDILTVGHGQEMGIDQYGTFSRGFDKLFSCPRSELARVKKVAHAARK